MSAHTAGPWQVASDGSLGTVETESGVVIAQAMQVRPRAQDMKHVERMANARLIAAAPDLLKALRGMLSAWNMVCDANGFERDHIQQQKDAVAAIAKATGEAP